jgi:hypothetical protein
MIACAHNSLEIRHSRAHLSDVDLKLLPVAGVPDVAAALFAPLAFNPYGSAMWGTGVVTMDPDIAVAVPAVKSRNPDPTLVWGGGHDFNGARRRWTNADDNLCVGSAYREEEAADCGEKLFLHRSFSFWTAPG